MTVRVRFAPSPTGLLHVGNARIALVNWLFARRAGGAFILRLDDTDPERSRLEFAAAIEEDLAWLGLRWDLLSRQSERLEHYRVAFERLRAGGRLYPCYETPEELEAKRRRQRARGRPPVYDRAALELGEGDRRRLEAEGRRPYWRFRLEARTVAWDDLLRGAIRFDARSVSDPVLYRADGWATYTLASVVDDLDLRISHVLRGEDHLANTAVQMQIFEALGPAPGAPAFGHLPLLVGPKGESLSKRLGSLSLRALKDEGVEPLALASLLAKLGSSDPIEPRASLDELAAEFELAKLSAASPKFDRAELLRLNARLVHELPFDKVAQRLRAMGLEEVDEKFWRAVRPNIARLDEAVEWWQVCRDRLAPVIEDAAYLAKASELLPAGRWNERTWQLWMEKLEAATGRKGRALYHPLRLALTAREHGPELKNLLPVIGRERARARLRGKAV